MYKCKYFKIYELVDKTTFENTPEWKLWGAFDSRILRVIDIIREDLGVSMTINNWKWGKDRQWSGLRNNLSPYYSPWSQHSYGRAIDFICSIPAPEVRKRIKKLLNDGNFLGIVDSLTLEHTLNGKEISWVHIDCRNASPGYHELHI